MPRTWYRNPYAVEDIHHELYYADLLYGDSATMACEAGCMGIPAICMDDRGRGYTDELDKKYGLVYKFRLFPARPGMVHPEKRGDSQGDENKKALA